MFRRITDALWILSAPPPCGPWEKSIHYIRRSRSVVEAIAVGLVMLAHRPLVNIVVSRICNH